MLQGKIFFLTENAKIYKSHKIARRMLKPFTLLQNFYRKENNKLIMRHLVFFYKFQVKKLRATTSLQNLPVGHFPLVFVLHMGFSLAYRTKLPSFCKRSRSGGFAAFAVFDSQADVPSVFLITRFPFDWYWKTSILESAVLLDQSEVFLHINSKLPVCLKTNSRTPFSDSIELPLVKTSLGWQTSLRQTAKRNSLIK